MAFAFSQWYSEILIQQLQYVKFSIKHFGSERMNELDSPPALRSTGLVNEIDDCFTVLEVQK